MRIDRILPNKAASDRQRPDGAEPGADGAAPARPAGRALVAQSGGRERPVTGDAGALFRHHASAPFIAQLAANKLNLPQTRPRRRLSHSEGSVRYMATERLPEDHRCLPRRLRDL